MNLILQWNHIVLDAIRQLGKLPASSPDRGRGGPPQVARSIGVIYTCVYDAWAAYDSIAKPTHSTIPRRPAAQRTDPNRRKAICQAAYRALTDQFPLEIYREPFKTQYANAIQTLLATEGMVMGDGNSNPNVPVGVGNLAADAVLAFRHGNSANPDGDFANQKTVYKDTTGYVPENRAMPVLLPSAVDAIAQPGKWQPLSYLNADHDVVTPAYIAPHWGNVKPFALTSGAQFRPTPPQSVLSQGFYDQARHVVAIQADLTPEQKVIAEYWADGPNSELPPGHWTEFAAFVAEREPLPGLPQSGKLGLDDTVKLFFALGNAIFDASIATWECKRHYDYVRPLTAIRHLFRGKTIQAWGGAGKGTQAIQGESWIPFQVPIFPTPPFAEYTSGHSGFSMAAATVLKRYTGSDRFGFFYAQTEPLKADPSVPVNDIVLSWPTFSSAAREAGESRLYGGIHFYEGNVAGLNIGEKVGNAAFNRAQDLWSGA
ncbi:MAG: vanadium-dependent haloperoxidase [Methylomonas sp.]|nr:vanadium-dependent haloperoxidase [Methylomonas sp.]PPD20647.1 MAG: phosphoesterase [Methylomonas sp.]PPD25516.1 MAG: phosphoesterase [Methylomonas sp.]PPD36309.1 MAG: phosphoesterase [Methylomonas sp.]PPD40243.1 MAG: phosphoesterase [Methylomonas sp.]